MNTPLSYSLAAFRPGGYADAEERLLDLKELGFQWVTLTPTFPVQDSAPLRIDTGRGPGIDELKAAVESARGLGLRLQIDPHLDFQTTLTGGPYEWRRRMYFSPKGAYLDSILYPLAALGPDALTLGSELDISLAGFAEDWSEVRQLFPSLTVGHKLNHDSLHAGAAAIRRELNAERARLGESGIGRWAYRALVKAIGEYLGTLDYVGFSFYPDATGDTPLTRHADRMKQELKKAAGGQPCFAIGEFGLGSADLSRPWHFDAATFRNPEALVRRRQYYLEFLKALRESPGIFGAHPASFWTVGHFDFLDGEFRDDDLRAAVKRYNLAS